MMTRKEKPNETPRKEKMQEALAHYDEIATKACWHRSDIPEAIRAYYASPSSATAEEILQKYMDMSMIICPLHVVPRTVALDAMHEFAALQNKPQPTAEGAEEILASLIESLGEPTNIHNHVFEIRPYTVEHKTEWWIFHKEVSSGEPLAQWLSKFASLHAQKIADKMVGEKWINVKDRLPRKDGKSSIYCLVNSEYDGIVMRPYNEYHQCWDTEDADDYYCDAIGGKITHWTPLPNPPIK